MYLSDLNNIGICTTDPTEKLDVNGNISMSGTLINGKGNILEIRSQNILFTIS